MKNIVPIGDSILVLPLPKEPQTTDAGIQLTDTTIAKAKVMEVSKEYSDTYKKGDVILYAENAGIYQRYKQQNCLWLNAVGFPKGHIIAVIEEEK